MASMRLVRTALSGLGDGFVRYVPGVLGQRLRYAYYKKRLKYLGRGVTIDDGVFILNPSYVSIGDGSWIDKNVILAGAPPTRGRRKFHLKPNRNYSGEAGELGIGKGCHIAPFSFIQAHGGVSIGNYVGIASGSKLYSLSHHYKSLDDEDNVLYKFSPRAPDLEQSLIIGPIVMEDNSALGLNSIVLPGATIGKNSWVGVNSSVLQDIPPNSIAGGNPATVLKARFQSGNPTPKSAGSSMD
jgi:acetyltransferase-like isoleucine patch superfamily enzyme